MSKKGWEVLSQSKIDYMLESSNEVDTARSSTSKPNPGTTSIPILFSALY